MVQNKKSSIVKQCRELKYLLYIWVLSSLMIPNSSFGSELSKELVFQTRHQDRNEIHYNPILSQDHYEALLKLNDYSNAIAIAQTAFDRISYRQFMIERSSTISNDLKNQGWKNLGVLVGATGADNRELDSTGVMMWNKKRRLLIVAFHGSRNGSLIWNDGSGDWGANLDSQPVYPESIGLIDCPEQKVKIHRGFGRNFQSVQKMLYQKLDQVLSRLTLKERKQTWVWFTGHSKGAAIASLGAVFTKHHFARMKNQLNINIGAILFSGPRTFFEDRDAPHSSNWVHSILGRGNVLRINVHGDPVPVSLREREGWRDLGVFVKDEIREVNNRAGKFYGFNISGFFNIHGWAGYHYGSGLRSTPTVDTGLEFDPNVVMTYPELRAGLERGFAHMANRSKSLLY